MNILNYGYTGSVAPDSAGAIPARVIAVHRERYEIICENGPGYAKLKTGAYYNDGATYPTAGDFVMIIYNPMGDSQITATLPRRTYFSRRNPSVETTEQAVAANFDYVFIMQSLNQDLNSKRLERYLTLAWQSGAVPAIILTKADLVEDPAAYLNSIAPVCAGVNIHVVSAKTGSGLDALDIYLQPGKTVVFLGSSGVGKSSLVNALAGEEIMTTRSIREDDSKGRHTTTHRQLIKLNCGAMIIDTPGMRELGMWEISEGLPSAFSDVEQFLGQCRFRDCTHTQEPGCAIRGAIARGDLEASRWESYRALKEESVSKEEMLRRKREWFKNLSKMNKHRKKEIW